MAGDIKEMNDILFDTLRGLKSNSVDPDKARAIVNVSQTILNSAKVLLDHKRLTGSKDNIPLLNEEQSISHVEDKPKTIQHTIASPIKALDQAEEELLDRIAPVARVHKGSRYK